MSGADLVIKWDELSESLAGVKLETEKLTESFRDRDPVGYPLALVDGSQLLPGAIVYEKRRGYSAIPLEVVNVLGPFSKPTAVCKGADGWNIRGHKSDTYNAHVKRLPVSSLTRSYNYFAPRPGVRDF